MKPLDDKTSEPVALITGVSSGIGHAAARVLIDAGWEVWGTVRNESDAQRLRETFGSRFQPLLFDVRSDSGQHADLARHIQSLLGGRLLSGLVHNAGVAFGGPLSHLPEEDFTAMMETNVLGVFRLTRALLPLLGAGSRVVMISSVSGRLVTPFVGGYATSKFALEAMTDAYRNELGMLGIRVIGIQPGPILTPIWKKALGGADYRHTPFAEVMGRKEDLIRKTERAALPAERVAGVILRALTTPRPSSRYLITRKSWMVRLAGWLPDAWKDRLIARRIRQNRKWG